MKIKGTIFTDVVINPIKVIENLITEIIGIDGRVIEKDNKYYKVTEEIFYHGNREEYEEITKESYEYIQALYLILKYKTNNL